MMSDWKVELVDDSNTADFYVTFFGPKESPYEGRSSLQKSLFLVIISPHKDALEGSGAVLSLYKEVIGLYSCLHGYVSALT